MKNKILLEEINNKQNQNDKFLTGIKRLKLPSEYDIELKDFNKIYDHIKYNASFGVSDLDSMLDMALYFYKFGFINGFQFLRNNSTEPYDDQENILPIDVAGYIEKLEYEEVIEGKEFNNEQSI